MLAILENSTVIWVSAWLTTVLLVIFIYLYVRKKGRDERERGIFATASFIALCVYFAIVNLSTALGEEVLTSWKALRSIIVHTATIVLLVHLIATLILKKIR